MLRNIYKSREVSVVIVYFGRINHLINTLDGLESGTVMPDEVILIEMGNDRSEIPEYNLEIKYNLITNVQSNNLPMSRARNHGAMLAQFETLIFLDVDCIPSNNFIHSVKTHNFLSRSIYMGLPMYLTSAVDIRLSLIHRKNAIEHPNRPQVTALTQTKDYGLFWSLCFFIDSALFFELGGFDETYTGYGIEDTDLAWKCQNMDVDFYLTTYKIYHQPHSFQRPPLSNLESIVRNCNHFYTKWKHWPMSKQLTTFSKMGLIHWSPYQSLPIEIVKHPNEVMKKDALVIGEPFA